MKERLPVLKKNEEIVLEKGCRKKLLNISDATIDRLLGEEKSAPSKSCNTQLVKIQPDERLATTSEQTFTYQIRQLIFLKPEGAGYRAIAQAKGLSPEILVMSEADAVHLAEGSSLNTDNRRGRENLTGSETIALCQMDTIPDFTPFLASRTGKSLNFKQLRL